MKPQFRFPSALVVLIGCSLGVWGQDDNRPSHDFGNQKLTQKNLSELLKNRRSQPRSRDMDTDMMRRLIENFGGAIDPAKIDPEMVRNFLRNNPEFRDPQNLERLRDLVERQMRENPEQFDPKKWADAMRRLEEIRRQKENNPFNDPIPDPKDKIDNPPPPPKQEEPPPPPKKDEKPKEPRPDRQAKEFDKWLRKNFGDSPAVQKAVKEFSDRMAKAGNMKNLDWMPKMNPEWNPFRNWNKNQNPDKPNNPLKMPEIGSGLKLPERPNVDRPNLSLPSTGSSSGDNSFRTASTGSGGSDIGMITTILLVLLLGGVAVWYFLVRKPPVPMTVVNTEAPPPPVDLLHIATREDVIAAFEQLSVTKCGNDARNWHHLEIAERMAERIPEQQDAVNQLAGLYEKARYAPADTHFTEKDLAAARHNLHLVVGEPTT